MAEINDLVNAISDKNKLLDTAITQYGKRGKTFAQAEMDYKIALAKKIIEERDRGTPVTIISDVCRGDPYIAKLRFERDCAEVVYRSALEAINSYKLQIRMMDSQLSREWENA